MDFQKLAEPGRVVVAHGLGVAETFQQRRRFQYLFGDQIGRRFVDGRQVLHDEFGGLRFAGTRLAGDDDHLISSGQHPVRGRADGEQMADGR